MICLFIIAVVFLTDFFVKKHVEQHLPENRILYRCKGKVRFLKVHNRGTAFSRKEKDPEKIKRFSLIAILCVFGAMLSEMRNHKGNKGVSPQSIGYALMLGGACSNLYDRVKRGYVTDYISYRFRYLKKLRKYFFNLSDVCIFAGALLQIFGSKNEESA